MPLKTTARILIVDDKSTMRKIIKNMLQKMGYTNFKEAHDGKLAWQMLQDSHDQGQPIEFIISDWNMPAMTGLDLLKSIRADERFKTLPFLMVTAEAEQANVVIAVKAGVSSFIVKPFAAVTFKEKMNKIFP